MAEPVRTLTLPDGRTLAYALWGDPNGFPVIGLHGTPGCRLNRLGKEDAYKSAGVHYITHDRSGYGRSTRRPGRSVADAVEDVAALADALGLERFAVTGRSGGGPHALACAALLGERVVRVSCHVSLAPFGSEGLARDAWLAGMDPENVKEFGWTEAGESVLKPEVEREYGAMVERVARDPATFLGNFQINESDRAAFGRPDFARVLAEAVPEMCPHDVSGWVDDNLAFMKPWGFDLAAIRVPVMVRYGRGDVLVPASHGDWLAKNVPGVVARVDDAAGHMSADPIRDFTDDIAWLRGGTT